MANKSMGEIISTLRKEKEMTQKELADKLNITDKAVSKWERDLACPDTQTLPKVAELLGVSIEELLRDHPDEEDMQALADKVTAAARESQEGRGDDITALALRLWRQ